MFPEIFSGLWQVFFFFIVFRYSIVEQNTLHITNLVAEDSGVFQCFAANAAGEIDRASYLQVFSKSNLLTYITAYGTFQETF